MGTKVMLSILGTIGVLFLISLVQRGTPIPPKDILTPGNTPDSPIAFETAPPPPAGEVTLIGEMGCLPHKGNPQIITLECAFGFLDREGRWYGVRGANPEQLSSSHPVQITGTFIPAENEKYASMGIIEVSAIETLSTERGVTLTGTFGCLPHTNTTGPQTEECAFGFKTDDGTYYAVNFGASASMAEQFSSGTRGTFHGTVTPLEMLGTDQWQKYPIKGIFTITAE
jgi:hypothetical protein